MNNIQDYIGVRLQDCSVEHTFYGIIMLHNKHKIEDFQQAIYDIKDRYYEEGNLEWQVSDILEDKSLEKFNWFMIPVEYYDFLEV